jgi:hypothetical protein
MIGGLRGSRALAASLVKILRPAFVPAIAIGMVPAVVVACPACAGSSGGYGAVIPIILGFLCVPFLVAGGGLLIIRRVQRGSPPGGVPDVRFHPGPVVNPVNRSVGDLTTITGS